MAAPHGGTAAARHGGTAAQHFARLHGGTARLNQPETASARLYICTATRSCSRTAATHGRAGNARPHGRTAAPHVCTCALRHGRTAAQHGARPHSSTARVYVCTAARPCGRTAARPHSGTARVYVEIHRTAQQHSSTAAQQHGRTAGRWLRARWLRGETAALGDGCAEARRDIRAAKRPCGEAARLPHIETSARRDGCAATARRDSDCESEHLVLRAVNARAVAAPHAGARLSPDCTAARRHGGTAMRRDGRAAAAWRLQGRSVARRDSRCAAQRLSRRPLATRAAAAR
jgi:hypothetical protein